jgi:hypothetical protein
MRITSRPHITDPLTGECTDVELFVAVLGASNFTYVEATRPAARCSNGALCGPANSCRKG